MKTILLPLAALVVVCNAVIQNIDLQQPLVRMPPDALNDEGYFGYKLVLHQKEDPNDLNGFQNFIDNTYVVVGAPNGSLPTAMVDNPGFVYECPISTGSCSLITGVSDGSANNNLEEQSGQFMGGALASSGTTFIACGHRYVNFNPNNRAIERDLFGRCFYSDRDLEGFTEVEPCNQNNLGRENSEFGSCEAGMSVTIAEDNGGNDRLIIGAPGSRTWNGALFRARSGTRTRLSASNGENFDWRGYATTKGNFRTTNREDIVTSVPRANRYVGAVNIYENTNNLQRINQNLVGEQMGEYYGFSVEAIRLSVGSNSLDGLLVSAPMYTDSILGPETGRVYIYQNNGGTLEELNFQLVGTQSYARFGHAMATMGDITGDGFDDVAISAPFGTEGGTVYIYHSSSQGLTRQPQQTIYRDRLNLKDAIVSGIMSFGTALASRVDIDGNNFNDLAIGSYRDQSVFVLRTRSLAQISTTLTASPSIVDLENGMTQMFIGESHVTFVITLCVQYMSDDATDPIDLNILLIAEEARRRLGLQQRVFFDSAERPFNVSATIPAQVGQQQCRDFRVFVEEDIGDFLNSFEFSLQATSTDFTPNPSEELTDLTAFPVVTIVGAQSLEVALQLDCDDPCISDLGVQANGDVTYLLPNGGSSPLLTVGRVTDVIVPLTITNMASNAYRGQLTFSLPNQQLVYREINDTIITCTPGNGNGREIPYVCDLENPFPRMSQTNIQFRFGPTQSLTGTEGNIPLTFSIMSLNDNNMTVSDNNVNIMLELDTEADIFVDPGISNPDQVTHSPVRLDEPIMTTTQLGPEFATSFTVGNLGPSIIPNARLTIYWPLETRSPDDDYYYLYPYDLMLLQSASTSITCDPDFFNPENYMIPANEDLEGQGGPEIVEGGKRRRRSVGANRLHRRHRRRNIQIPRQELDEDIPISLRRTVSCDSDSRDNTALNHTCAPLVCNISQLSAGDRVQISILAHIDERLLGGNVDSFMFIPFARVEIVDADYISEAETSNNVNMAEFLSVPGEIVVNPVESSGEDDSLPWYAIAIPIIAAVILIIIVAVALYFCGFFRRKNKKQIEDQAKENLARSDGTDL